LSSCSEVKPQKQKTHRVHDAGTVSIIMYDDSKLRNEYRVYVDSVDTNSTLFASGVSEYKISAGSRVIQVIKKRETASLKLNIEKGKLYTLKVIKDDRDHIQLLQVANSLGE
jgi:hypothetical protein